jgi:hypothetical protein
MFDSLIRNSAESQSHDGDRIRERSPIDFSGSIGKSSAECLGMELTVPGRRIPATAISSISQGRTAIP